uniref:Replication stress response regulator SDE2 n=1 Tax=Angiostrongylus cantonensis TaxID=6313 RepID=A0A0K0DC95_ANGCA
LGVIECISGLHNNSWCSTDVSSQYRVRYSADILPVKSDTNLPTPEALRPWRTFFSFREKCVIDTILRLDPKSYYCTVNGELVQNFYQRVGDFTNDDLFQLHFRLLGGKGGFGSLLRSFRVNKSTNQLMCRDLNGRRLASIEEEQKLRRWIEKAAEREKEKLERRNAKYEKLKSGPPKHMFHDPDYIRQKESIIEKTEEAFEQGCFEILESDSDSDFDENDDIDPELVNEIREYFSSKSQEIATANGGALCGSKNKAGHSVHHESQVSIYSLFSNLHMRWDRVASDVTCLIIMNKSVLPTVYRLVVIRRCSSSLNVRLRCTRGRESSPGRTSQAEKESDVPIMKPS